MRDEPDGMQPGVRERDLLVRRSWTRSERRVVLNGLFGRLLIAIEPVICFVVFGALTAGLIFFPLPAGAKMTHWESAIVLAPIFGLATLAFLRVRRAVARRAAARARPDISRRSSSWTGTSVIGGRTAIPRAIPTGTSRC